MLPDPLLNERGSSIEPRSKLRIRSRDAKNNRSINTFEFDSVFFLLFKSTEEFWWSLSIWITSIKTRRNLLDTFSMQFLLASCTFIRLIKYSTKIEKEIHCLNENSFFSNHKYRLQRSQRGLTSSNDFIWK